jgi:hypothetical protein
MNDTIDSRTRDTDCSSPKKISKSPITKKSFLFLEKINLKSDTKKMFSNKTKINISKKFMNENIDLNNFFTQRKKDKQFQKNIKDITVLNEENEKVSASTEDSSLNSTKSGNENEKINFQFSKNFYCNYYPKKKEMREMPDKKPTYFPTECFHGVNYFHNNIGNKEFLNLTNNSVYNNNIDEYKIIDRKDHLFLNHLTNKNANKKSINSITIKYRHKNTTFLYYS